MTRSLPIGRLVVECVCAGLLLALTLVIGPLGGAREHVITGSVLLALATGWGCLAMLSARCTAHPQRWAATLAVFFFVAGAALLIVAPGADTIDTLGWIWPPVLLVLVAMTAWRVHHELPGWSRVCVVYPLLALYAVVAVGGAYQTAREFSERRTYQPAGQLVDVGGYRLHLACAGHGTPTVLLESGLGETAAYWEWISTELAYDTRVCVYDRAGRGWSDPAPAAQDGLDVAGDLASLLDHARITGPLVLVGHSSGAQYVRIFAGRYPERVAGMVLLDGQPADALEHLPNYPAFYHGFRRISAVLPSLARVGVGRLVVQADAALPETARATQRLHRQSPALYRSLRDEFAALPASLTEARQVRSLGDRPLVVISAAQDAQAGWLPLQDALASLSTNSRHRIVPCTHEALVTSQTGARWSIQAVRDVINAVRFTTRLPQ